MSGEVDILIIDASPLFRASLAELILKKHPGVQIRETATAESALARTAEQQPDLILMDIHLIDGNGIELIARFAARLPDATIAVITNSDAQEYRDAVVGGGADYFISKVTPNHKFILDIVHRKIVRKSISFV
jgi:DNA-binding NarL/FixJ family response regulator